MSNGHIHVGDVGTPINAVFKTGDGVVVDISTAITKTISFEDPDGVSIVKNAEFINDGTDGQITYELAAGDIDQPGKWHAQGRITFEDGADLRSDRVAFRVALNNNDPAP